MLSREGRLDLADGGGPDRRATRRRGRCGSLRWPLKLLRTLVRVIPQAIDGYFADRCGQHAAGIAYRVLFSLVPLSIILVAIFGIVLRNDGLKNQVIAEIVDAFPLSESGSADVTRADREAGVARDRSRPRQPARLRLGGDRDDGGAPRRPRGRDARRARAPARPR